MSKPILMEFTSYISPDGEVYDFDEGTRWLVSEEGLGMPSVDYITQKSPHQHGETVIDYRFQKRVIQLIERVDACDRYGYWEERANILDTLRPNRQTPFGSMRPGTFRKLLPNGDIRCIDALIEQGPGFAARQQGYWDEWGFTETIRFIAHDPSFYDPNLNTFSLVSSVAITDLEFPITFPIEFSNSLFEESNTLYYLGNYPSFPNIEIHGPASGATITNESTGELIQLNYTVPSGRTVLIRLETQNKRVEDWNGNILRGVISEISNFGSFHLAPHPEVTDGENLISALIGNASASTGVNVKWYDRYIGI